MRTLTRPSRRARASCSVLALATVLVVGASPAAAQSFQGTGTFVTNTGGSAAITTPNATTTNINVNTGQTVINWSPFDTAISPNPINFQNAGTTATFSGSGSYAVLNRINPVDSTRAISMNGTIMATSLGVAAPGAGSIYFYSPGGFVIGANAVINVGSLVLSASPITLDGSGNFINGANRQVIFGQAPNAGAQISVSSGAQINALTPGSYVAMVAPSVIHNGAINVDGSAALVAAEAATINFSPDGLFAIQVDAGTTSAFGISTTGDIGGPASSGADDNHRIYMVAVPKNQALTMVIGAGADLGFNVAGAANVDGNAIVLSAGHDIVDGVAGAVRSAGGGTGDANLNAFNFNATSAINGIATLDVRMGVTSGNSTFHSDVNLKGGRDVFLSSAFAGSLLTVKGDISLSADKMIAAGTSGSAGLAALYATDGGTLVAEQDVTVTADASGAGSSTAGVAGGNATGGRAYVQAQSGGSLTVLGAATMSADGNGGNALVAGAAGGSGTGGTIQFQTFDTGSTVAVSGGAFASANGAGGSSSTSGSAAATGQGGTMYIGARSANSQFTLGGILSANADGQGGFAAGTGVNGGIGRGGSIFVSAISSGAQTNLNGGADVSASGYGGDSGGEGCFACDGAGGAGTGGSIQFSTSSGALGTALTVNGNISASTEGRGGFGITNGGAGTGGSTTSTFAANSAILLNGNVDFSALGHGGDGSGGNGGAGTGGTVKLGSQTGAVNGSLTVTGNVYADVSGFGGDAYGPGAGGLGRGGLTDNGGSAGTVDFQADFSGLAAGYGGYSYDGIGGAATGGNGWVDAFGATIHIGGDYSMSTDAYGGSGTTGGNATGGNAYLAASSTFNLDGSAVLSANGTGGYGYGGNGGSGTGGLANLRATNGATLTAGSSVVATASGYGGDGSGTIGGSGTGGQVDIQSLSGGTLNIEGSLTAQANGWGGADYEFAADGGAGFGGTARVFAAAGTSLTVDGLAQLEANGVGGGNVEGEGDGGLGDGGLANVYSSGGVITFNDNVILSASATGGSTASGLGGAALGGSAQFGTDGGDIMVTGNLTLDGSATGGNGDIGGNATALVSPPTNELSPVAVSLYAGNGGSITVGGQATLDGRAQGGTGFNGNGGNAIGGEADVVPYVGDISLGSLLLDVSSRGGNGGNGGNGGSGQGGAVDVTFGFESAPVDGSITLGSATITADGYGGNGGAGSSANFGGNGGNGGAGVGGSIAFIGSAAGGTLDSGLAMLSALGVGGQGGAGGNGDSGTGGGGGAGGGGTGGFIQTGTISQSNSPGSGGGAAFDALYIDSSAIGGIGGNGGSGGGGNGAGGNGGDAAGGSASFLIRGVLGTADSVFLMADATGGDGGSGSTAGDGGDARTGIITVESKDRFDVPAERGTMVVNSIVGSAVATGGSGATAGTSTVVDGSYFRVLNGDATIGSVSITLSGDLIDSTFGPSFVSVRDGTATIGSFSFVTDGNLSLFADSGDMHAGSLTLAAGNFVFDPVNDPPSNRGTYFADTATISTGNNFVTTANLDIGGNLTIDAPGLIDAHNFTIGGDLYLAAWDGDITVNDLDVDGRADLHAAGSILLNTATVGFFHAEADGSFTSDDITSDTNIQIDTGANMTLGDLVAGLNVDPDSSKAIRLDSGGSILVGNAIAKDGIDFSATGSVTGGNLTSGISVGGDAGGAIHLGAISAGLINPQGVPDQSFSVGIASETSITTGNVAGAYSVGFATLGPITTGTINAGADFLVMASGNMLFGPITAAGRVYLADSSMFIAAGGCGDCEGDNFDPELVFGATPVPSLGSITINGPTLAGSFQAAAGTFFSSGAITTNGLLAINAGTSISVGAIDAGTGAVSLIAGGQIGGSIATAGSIYATSGGAMTLTNLDSGGDIFLRSGGQLGANNLNAGGFIDARSASAMTLGNLVADDFIDLRSNGAILLLNATSGETINFLTAGSLTGLAITAGESVLAQAMGAIQLGSISAGIVDPSSTSGAAYAVRLASNVAITTGAVIALGNIGFGTPTTLTTGNLTSGGGILALVGGNMSLGTIVTGDAGYVYLADYSMAALGGAFETFNRAPILASAPVATGGSILLGGPVTTGDFTAAAGTTLTGTSIDATGVIYATSGGNMALTVLDAEDDVYVRAAGTFASGPITSQFGSVDIGATGGIAVTGDIDARRYVSLLAGGPITAGDIFAGTYVRVDGSGSVALGDISAGLGGPQQLGGGISPQDVGPGNPVEIFSDTAIATGNISTDGYVGLYSAGSLTVGSIDAGHDVIALAGGDASFGPVTTPERFFLAGYDSFDLLFDSDVFDPELIFDQFNVAFAGGNASFAGESDVGQFEALVSGDTAIQSISAAEYIAVDTVGLLSINGAISSDYMIFTSGDIAIGQQASINAPSGIVFASLSPTGTFIGDNLAGDGGYRLNQAELDRVTAGTYEFEISTDRGAAPLMVLGDLQFDFADSEVDEPLDFTIWDNGLDETPDGIIRIVGNVAITIGADQHVDFSSITFEIDAATGSLSLTNSSGGLSGLLSIEAKNIFIASGDILAKLEENPAYAGYVQELNAPAAQQRPDGVLRAAVVKLNDDGSNLENILIQNTGTSTAPAGFLISDLTFTDGDGEEDIVIPPGSINMVINGQIETPTGTLTGVAVRDAMISEFDTAPFTAASTINGCPLTGTCGAVAPPPPPQIVLINSTDVQLTSSDILGDSPDEGGGDSSSPIGTPTPLFDTSPLAQSGDIDDPVSGAGNPSLYGIHSDDDEDEEDEEEGDVKPVKESAKGDGQ